MSICVLDWTDQTTDYTIMSLGEIHGRVWRGKQFQCCGQSGRREKKWLLNNTLFQRWRVKPFQTSSWLQTSLDDLPHSYLLSPSPLRSFTCISWRAGTTSTSFPWYSTSSYPHIQCLLGLEMRMRIPGGAGQVFCLLEPPHSYLFATTERTMHFLIQLQTFPHTSKFKEKEKSPPHWSAVKQAKSN